MILLLPVWEPAETPPMVPSALQLEHGSPRIVWALQSYERLVHAVIAVVSPAHLQGGIQIHLPRSTALKITTTPMRGAIPMCLMVTSLINTDEELLIADPNVAFEHEAMREAIRTWRLGKESVGLSHPFGAWWWRHGKDFVKAAEDKPEALSLLALFPPPYLLSEIQPKVFPMEDEGQWVSQGEWR